jgi:hypothetical protein
MPEVTERRRRVRRSASAPVRGIGGAYRLDQPDDQSFLAGFGIHP